MARVVFMGTPQFAVPTLSALDDHHHVVGVVTQPDRQAGRGRKIEHSPVKAEALARRLAIFQPATLRTSEAVAHLAAWEPDVMVVAAFGQILRQPVLELAPHGCLNVHASLLPRYRGAAPIQAAILAGDTTTGVTIMRMDEGLDTGPVLVQTLVPIEPDDTAGSLTATLAELGAQLLVETLPGWLQGEVPAHPQDDSLATYCRLVRKQDGNLDWAQPAAHLERQVRAYDPWPGAYSTWHGQRLKVLRSRVSSRSVALGQPGEMVDLEPQGLGVITGEGVLELLEVQLAGKKPMDAGVFARGQRGLIGSLLGT